MVKRHECKTKPLYVLLRMMMKMMMMTDILREAVRITFHEVLPSSKSVLCNSRTVESLEEVHERARARKLEVFWRLELKELPEF